jgi:Spy/CpxP family protein refolding chaperone
MQRKTISVVPALVLFFTVFVAQAQESDSTPNSRDVINRMAKELGLNEKQQSKVAEILNTERQKVEAVFNEERKKLQLIQEETRKNLQAVLTPEQMEKLDKKMRQESSKSAAPKK